MLGKKLVLAGMAGCFFLFSCIRKEQDDETIFLQAVPIDALMIIKINSYPHFASSLNEAVYSESLLQTPAGKNLRVGMHFLDSLRTLYENLRYCTEQSPLYFSFHATGKEKAGWVAYLPLKKNTGSELKQIRNSYGSRIEEKVYNHTSVYIFNSGDNKEYCFCSTGNLLMISSSLPLLEKALRQKGESVSLLSDPDFSQLITAAGKKVDGNVFIHIPRVLTWVNSFLSPSLRKHVAATGPSHQWTELDILLKNDRIIFSGLSLTNHDLRQYLQLFSGQQPQQPEVISLLPNTVSAFIFTGYSDPGTFYSSYRSFLNYQHKGKMYETYLNNINRQYNTAIEKSFLLNRAGETCWAFTSDDTTMYFIQQINDRELFVNELQKIVPEGQQTKEKIATQIFPVYTLPESMISSLCPSYFTLPSLRYATLLEDFFIVAESKESLTQFIYLSLSGSKLIYNKRFESFTKNIPGNSNILIYCDAKQSHHFIQKILNNDLLSHPFMDFFKTSTGCCLQISSMKDNFFYTNLAVQYESKKAGGFSLLWKCKLDTLVAMQPVKVKNHVTSQTEFLVQDARYQLYLIDGGGRILWKKPLEGPVCGTIFQIDYYKNNKLQYLFNTSHALHLIDRNGDYVEHYPIVLDQPAVSPLSVADYDNNKEYRLFIGVKEKGLLCLTREGKTVEGWKSPVIKGNKISPVQHIRLGDKDYLVFSDSLSPYFLNRRGETRVKLSEPFIPSGNCFFSEAQSPVSEAHFITTDMEGHIQLISTGGKVTTLPTSLINKIHFFDYQDFNEDGQRDFILSSAGGINVYNQQGKLICSINPEVAIDFKPIFYNFDTLDIKIQVFSMKEQKILFIDRKGKIKNELVMPAPASGLLYEINKKYYFLAGGVDGYLYNYTLQ